MQTALSEFRTSLSRVRDLTDDIVENTTLALADAKVRARHETIRCSCTVILSGYFESFLREVAEAAIREICTRARPFPSLPDSIQQTHFEDGARVLTSVTKDRRNQRPTWVLATTQDITRRLHSVHNALPPYEIVWEAFAETGANPGPNVIGDFLQRFGIKKVWPTIAQRAAAPETALVENLRNLILKRNECAHTGTASLVPTVTDIITYCDTLETIGQALIGVIDDHIAAL